MAGTISITGSTIQGVAAFILVLKISRYPGFKEFLDK